MRQKLSSNRMIYSLIISAIFIISSASCIRFTNIDSMQTDSIEHLGGIIAQEINYTILGEYSTAGDMPTDLVVYMDKCYLSFDDYFLLLNCTDPSDISVLYNSGFVGGSGLFIDGQSLYIVQYGNLTIYNVMDFMIQRISSERLNWSATEDAENVVVENAIAYVTKGTDGLYIVNVTNPYQPEVMSSYSDGSRVENVAVYNNY
ncbi:MAG: hypothetical protein ACTSSH_06830, partial [Candidatus Heimdallarchaeota archaeon]